MEVSDAKRLRTVEGENTRLKRLLADAMLDSAALKELFRKKVVTPAASGKLSHMSRVPTGERTAGSAGAA
jgi:hypothetical protein